MQFIGRRLLPGHAFSQIGLLISPSSSPSSSIFQMSLMRFYASASASHVDEKPLFDKILIANRGEIACRVMDTAKKLNIKTVAVFSEADRNSLHVRRADEAYLIGPAASKESYLVMEKIIGVAKKSGAQAIHPGYGFLSENAIFADICKKEGVTFIGPPPQAIRDMGSKSASKIIMTKAGVPVVPGYHGEDQSNKKLKEEADKIGYPVLIKAIMGGGGKGMRIVLKPEDFEAMLESSRSEARNSFGDDKVLVEKYLIKPRHVEVQVFADTLGNAVYLFERDCSVQRRHQKILEEAPAPGLTAEKRKDLGTKAVAAAKAVNYVGAGTVEFIMDSDGTFYFMEMNTRLQVEHPVSEMITKTDLVHWQISVAAGNRLPLLQDQIKLHGHALEARIYAETPLNNFLPDTGKLIHLSTPTPLSREHMRIETGVIQGDEVSVFYDPMIAKLVIWEKDRNSAIKSLKNALDQYKVVGPNTNVQFLKDLITHRAFIAGDVETGFIQRFKDDLLKEPAPVSPHAIAQVVLFQLLNDNQFTNATAPESNSPNTTLSGWRLNERNKRTIQFKDGEHSVNVTAYYNHDGSYELSIHAGNKRHELKRVTGKLLENGHMTTEIDGHRINGTVVFDGNEIHVFTGSERGLLTLKEPAYLKHDQADASSILTPMPCKVTKVMVSIGQVVQKDQPLIALEAMKMEHIIKAPFAGKIEKIYYPEGSLVAEKQKLVSFAEEKINQS